MLRRSVLPVLMSGLLACGSGDGGGGPSPLVEGMSADFHGTFALVGDTGTVAVSALDTAGHPITGAAITVLNTTPGVATLYPDGRFVGHRAGRLVLRAVSGNVEQEFSTTIVDSTCGRIAAVPSWTADLGFAYALTGHFPAQYPADSFDVHINDRGTVVGAILTGPYVLDSNTVYWTGGQTTTISLQGVDTVHRSGGDSVYVENASAPAADTGQAADLLVYLDACFYVADGAFHGIVAASGPGVTTDTAVIGMYVDVFGSVAAPGVLSSGVDSVALGIAHHDGFSGGVNVGGHLQGSGLLNAVTQPSEFGSAYPFDVAKTGWDGSVPAQLGTAQGTWSLSPNLLDAPAPARRPPPRPVQRPPRRGPLQRTR